MAGHFHLRMSAFRGVVAAVIALLVAAGAGACATTAGSSSPSSSPPRASSPATLEDEFISVVDEVSPSVVAIQTATGLGSGVILDTSGDIVTNAHVVAGSSTFRVFLADGRSFPATFVGAYVPDDLAVLKIAAPRLRPAAFANSDQVRPGSIVMAIGSPLGLQGSVTEGIVSAVGRQVSEPNGVALPPLIQTSAPINPGNSGGALVNLEARVIGVTTLAAQDPQAGGTAPGIGFAIPSNITKDIASQLIANGHVVNSHRAYLGVEAATASDGEGAVVYSVVPGGPADQAGVRANDVIVSLAGRTISDQPDLASALSSLEPGRPVEVGIRHPDGSTVSVTVTLGELPG